MTTTLSRAGALWEPARSASFRRLWLGQALSLLGDGFSYLAFAWLTLSLTGSPLTLGYVLAAQAVPRALLTLVGGSLSDRWSPRRIMTLSALARAGVMTAVGAAALADLVTMAVVFAAAAVFGAVDAFFQPARQTILPSVVAKDMLPQANALLGAGARTAAVLGPAVGGVVVALSGPAVAFLVDGACFGLCGLLVSRVRVRSRDTTASAEQGEGLFARIRAGITYALRDPRIRVVLVLDTAVNFCYAGPFTVGFAELARTGLAGGATTLGLLNGALAGGAILGTLAGGAVGGRPKVGLLIAALGGWLAVGMSVLGLLASPAVAVGTVLVMGFGIGFQGVFGLSWIQRNIDGSVLSRVIAVDMVLGYAVAPVSLVLCGALAEVHTGLVFGGTSVILAVTALSVLCSRSVRAMR